MKQGHEVHSVNLEPFAAPMTSNYVSAPMRIGSRVQIDTLNSGSMVSAHKSLH